MQTDSDQPSNPKEEFKVSEDEMPAQFKGFSYEGLELMKKRMEIDMDAELQAINERYSE